jgi:hypothetical protein
MSRYMDERVNFFLAASVLDMLSGLGTGAIPLNASQGSRLGRASPSHSNIGAVCQRS